MNPRPYIGVTGPVTIGEVGSLNEMFSSAGFGNDSSHSPMIGILASHKTLNRVEVANRRYPVIGLLPELFKAMNGSVFPMVHYNSRVNVSNDSLSSQISEVFDGLYYDGLCNALQLNIPWPNVGEVTKIKNKFPNMKVVFQASRNIAESSSPGNVASRIASSYDGLVDYVLIDPSGGKGKPFDLEKSLKLYDALKEKVPSITVGFAGGFDGNNVTDRLKSLIERIGDKDFCIDAEGGLRKKLSNAYGDDLFDELKTGYYIGASATVLNG
jgi:phosphoribosylanthranilate isomerase